MEYTLHRRHVQLQGHTRKYIVVEPANLGPHPDLLLFFHGSLQSGSVMRRFTAGTFDDLAQRTATVLVYPEGVDRHFNDCRAQLPVTARTLNIDDVAFTGELVRLMREEYATARTLACGYSNGGQMVIRLLFDAPGLLDGACVFASTLGEGSNHAPSNPDSAYLPTPILFMHGTADPLAPYQGGMAGIDATRTRGPVTSAPWTAQHFAVLGGAQSTPELSQAYPGVEVSRWQAEQPVELWTMHGVGHVIPSGNQVDPRLGKNTAAFRAADVVEKFFELGR